MPYLNKRKIRLISATLTLFLCFFAIWVCIPDARDTNDNYIKGENNYQSKDTSFRDLKQSDYSPSSEGSGGDINVSLHQSLYDTTKKYIANTTDPTNSTFSVDSPADANFNSTNTYIELENIVSHNKTITLQTLFSPNATDDFSQGKLKANSFTVEDGVYLENASVYITAAKNKFFEFKVVIYNSSWSVVNSRSEPVGSETEYYAEIGIFNMSVPPGSDYIGWFECKNLHFQFDNSKTDNNTWFLGCLETVNSDPAANPKWYYVLDSDDGVDTTDAWTVSGGTWTYISPTVDFITKMSFNKASKFPVADLSEVSLKINGTAVVGSGGTGNWTSTETFSSSSGKLYFNVSAEWDYLECDIKLVQINFTKTDLTASSSYSISGSGQDIIWNVSRSINNFNSKFENYQINFTIPSTWSNIQVWNGTTNKTDNIVIDPLDNGYKIVQVMNAGNGTNWFLNATSSNLISSIDTYIGATATDTVNTTDIVHFNVTFSQKVSQDDGTINLEVYSPSAISNKLNFTSSLSTFSSGTEISIVDWDVSDNVTQVGEFRVQIFWSNDTAAGFLEKILTIRGATELSITSPPDKSTHSNTEIFNMTAYFNDTGLDMGITGADIDVDVNGTIYFTDWYDVGSGNYKIKINCSDSIFVLNEWSAIRVNISKQYYNNQSQTLTINVTTIVTDTTPPTWDEAPTDQTIEFGSPFSYDVNASDANGIDSYNINDTTNFQVDGNGVITNATALTIGVYWLEINASDPSNNNATATIKITVEDTTDPIWEQVPTDQTVELGQSFSYDLNATDLQTITYTVNDTSNFVMNAATGELTNNTALTVGVYSLQINATDASGNAIIAYITVTVEDTTDPTWIESPTNQGALLGQPFSYDLNATDLQTITYTVNDTSNFAMNAATGELTNNTALTVGVYSLQINATDASGNAIIAYITVSVTDTEAPQWEQVPIDQTVELGQPFNYDLNATDLQTITYSVNDTSNFAMNAATGELTNNTALTVGTYAIEVTASDGTNDNTTIIIITVEDTTDPTWDQVPTDQTVELGQPFSYDLNATDLQTITYTVNDTSNFAMNAATGELTNNTALTVSVYSLQINATDASGNMIIAYITVTVEDTTDPTWDQVPTNQTVELGQSFSYDLNATDLQSITYTVNDTSNFAMNAAKGELTNNTALTVGIYSLQINATDASGNVIIAYITVTVEDTTDPTWDQAPTDQNVELGQSFSYDLNATDLQSITYTVNDTSNFAMNAATGELTNNTALTVGSYSLQINATDASGNVIIAYITVTVEDTTDPTWDQVPTDQTVELGQPFSYDLNATDLQTITYTVNDTSNFAMNAATGELTNNTAFTLGVYSLQINATDASGNVIIAYITVTVEDTTDPTWDQVPTDQTVELGQSFSYDLNATDLQTITYTVNDTSNFAMNGATGELTNNTALTVGTYSLQINATDASGNVIIAYITVTVEDTTDPTWIEAPTNQGVLLGQTFSYDLNATDLQTITYTVNDTSNFAMNAATGELTNNTALTVGVYSLQINATDASGNFIIAYITVSVTDTEAPQWDEMPQDQTIELGQPFSYDLNATDLQTITYSVNDTTNFAMNAATGELTNNTFLTIGSYAIEVTASDGTNDNTTLIIITVEDTTDPTWDQAPTDQTVELGQPFSYDLNATDLQTITYTVNDTSNFAMNGATGELTNNTALMVGVYSLQINATDTSGNVIIAYITVTVEDTTDPTWDQVPTDQTVELGQSFSYDLNATDLQTITYTVNDTSNFAMNAATGELTNNTALTVGIYLLQINATDASGNVIIAYITVTVEDTTDPTWDQVATDQTVELGQSFSYDLNATDLQTIIYTVNDTSNFAMNAATGELTNNTAFTLGVYSLQINATDASGNVIIAYITVTVEDTTDPTWDQVPTDQTVELGQSFSYDLNATDLQTITYTVNDTSNFAMNGATGELTNNTALTVGVYSLQINATDASGNVIIAYITVTVEDTTDPIWDQVPTDQTVELGQSFSYDLNATDIQTIIYTVNDTSNFALNGATGELTNNTALTVGVYSLQINATDASGNVIIAYITVTVEDTTDPTWDQVPTDQTVELGQSFSYDLNATDLQTITYTVNDTTNFAMNAATGELTNNTALTVGVYSLQINATDASGNVIIAYITVTVEDTTDPTWIEAPTNQGVILGQPFSYDLNATDLQTITYTVNDTSNFAMNAATGELTNNTALTVGVYSLQINATDVSGNVIIAYITVSVTDTEAPQWVELPQDQTIELGQPFSYDLNATDLQTITYTVNDTSNFAMNAATGELTNNTALTVRSYIIEVTASDGTNDNTTVIIITIEDTTDPTWDQVPTDQTVELGQSFSYDLNATDLQTITYTVNDTSNFAMNAATGELTNNTALTVGTYSLQINATDASGNVIIAYITVTVEDTTDPTWDQAPTNQGVILGQPFSYDLNATDLQTITYTVNDTSNFAMNAATGELTNNTALSLGSYSLQINATDASGNVIIAYITVSVTDTEAPQWDQVPTDQTVELGQPFSYDLNATDLQTITYTVNDTSNFAMNAATGELTNITALTVGSYVIEVTASDGTNDNTTIIIITVEDTTNPIWDQVPTDQTIELGQQFSYDLNATDLQTIIYTVNDTSNFAMNAATGELTNNTALTVGVYSLQINATDASGNVIIEYITVTVEDTTDPTWDQAPTDQSVELGQSFSYDLNATDLQTITYTVNDTSNFAMNAATGELTNNTALTVGSYSLQINATDASGNVIIAYITVTVEDTTDPTWDQVPTDQTVELGQPFSYDLNATDLQTITYTVNDTSNFAMNAATAELTNNTALTVGVFSLQINATDASGNVIIAYITVTVEDTTDPTWDQVPTDQNVELGQSFSYDLNATDLQSITYTVNDTSNFAMNAATGELTNNKALTVGVYSLQINATDASGNVIIAYITVTVEDTTDPTWDQVPTDQSVELGQPFSYDLNATDLQTITYTVNDTSNFAMNSATGELTNNTALTVGVYSLQINATDASGNVIVAYITITVEDTTDPTWDQVPTDQTVELGQLFNYDLNATDLQTITYTVNDTSNFAMNAATGELTNNTALTVGVYSLQINATDASGNVIIVYITVTVEDTTDPTWDQVPTDQTVELGQPFSYVLNATDLHTITYTVNDTSNFAMNAATGELTNNTALTVGVYSLQINATDASGNVIIAYITVTVEDTTDPTWDQAPTNQGVILGQPFSYDLNATDLQTITYTVNDTSNFAMNAATGELTNNTALSLGSYSLQINATDASGNVIIAYITVSVTDTEAPQWDQVPTDQTVELGQPFSYDLNATDLQTITYSVNDTTNFAMNAATGELTNNTALTVGSYAIEVTASDGTNDNTTVIIITVDDTTDPTWDQVPTDQTVELGQSFSYDLNATDLQTIIYTVDDTSNFAMNAATGELTNNTALTVGVYSLQINASDASGNVIIAYITVTVEDTTDPTWDQVPTDQNVELGQSFSYDINATDLQTITYTVNNTTNFAMNAATGELTNNTALTVGVYSLQINATDASGNVITIIINVTVFEIQAIINTELIIDRPADYSIFDSGDVFNITVLYNNTDADQGISGATIEVDVDGIIYAALVSYIGNGYYNITIDGSDPIFNGYGWFVIRINASKAGHWNQTEVLNIKILSLTTAVLESPIPSQTYDSDYILTVELTFNDTIKGTPINPADIQWKVGAGGSYSGTNVTYNGVTLRHEIELWMRASEFDGFGNFIVFIKLNKTNYYNKTIQFDFRIIGLTSYNILNLTQYNTILTLNNSIHEAYLFENITIYANFINLYPNQLINGALGNLTFNGVNYYDYDLDNDGLYSWEINTSQLALGSYSFKISFNKPNYQNISSNIYFDINLQPAEIIIVERPYSVRAGENFNVTVSLNNTLTGKGIGGENLTITINFGIEIKSSAQTINYTKKTDPNGLATFNISCPLGAKMINITIEYFSSYDYASVKIIFLIPISIDRPGVLIDEEDEDKEEIILDISILTYIFFGIIGAGFVIGVFLAYREETEEDVPELILKGKSLVFMYIPEKAIETKESALVSFGKSFLKYIWLLMAIIIGSIFSMYFFIIPNNISILITILIVEIIMIFIIGAKFIKPEWSKKIKEKTTSNWKYFTLLGSIIFLAVIGIFIWIFLVSFIGITVIYNNFSILLLILIVEISSIIIVLIRLLKPEWRDVKKEKISFNWKILALIGGLILLLITGIVGWMQLSGTIFPPIGFSILIAILIAEIASILIVGAKLLKLEGYEAKMEKISSNWKYFALIGGLVLLTIIGIVGWMQLSGRAFTFTAFSILIAILIVEITSILIVSSKLLKSREKSDKNSTKWKFFILMISILLFMIIGVLWWFLLRV
ncbi:MAG: hypothetical protein ACFFAH_02720 [Promethearchaeota archaeon]